MTRGKYLDELTQYLSTLSDRQVKEIVAEIYAHFEEGIEAGYDEAAIAAGLGAPRDVAKEYLALYENDASPERAASPLRMFGEEPYHEIWELPIGNSERLKADIAHIEVVIAAEDGDSLRAVFDGYRVADANGVAPRIRIERDGGGVTIAEEHPRAQNAGWIERILSSVPRMRGKLKVTIPRKIGELSVDLKSGSMAVEGARVDIFKSEVRSGTLSVKDTASEGGLYMELRSGLQKLDNVTAEKLEFTVKSGTTRINGIQGGAMVVETSSGKVDARGVSVREEAELTVKSGEMQFREIDAKSLCLETHSGSISIQKLATDSVNAEVTSGSVRMRLLRGADAELSVRSGSIEMLMPQDEGFTYEAEAKSGRVQIDFDGKREAADGGNKRMRGVVGGGARKLKVETLSGSIQIREG